MTFAYDVANRIVTMLYGLTTTTFTYDDAGNLVEEAAGGITPTPGRTTYVYDCENRLIRVNNRGQLSTYSYDGERLRRTAHEPGSSLTTFVWDGSDYIGEY